MPRSHVGLNQALVSHPCLFPQRRVPACRLWGISWLLLFVVSWGWAHEYMRPAPAKMVRQRIEGRAPELVLVNQSGQPFLSVTAQPDVDTPAVLHAYAERLGVDLASWAFVTGHLQAVQAVWQAFGMTVKPRAKGVVDHPAWTFLIDREGMVQYRYLGSLLEVETVLEDMRTLW